MFLFMMTYNKHIKNKNNDFQQFIIRLLQQSKNNIKIGIRKTKKQKKNIKDHTSFRFFDKYTKMDG